jgi:hypothetical protein
MSDSWWFSVLLPARKRLTPDEVRAVVNRAADFNFVPGRATAGGIWASVRQHDGVPEDTSVADVPSLCRLAAERSFTFILTVPQRNGYGFDVTCSADPPFNCPFPMASITLSASASALTGAIDDKGRRRAAMYRCIQGVWTTLCSLEGVVAGYSTDELFIDAWHEKRKWDFERAVAERRKPVLLPWLMFFERRYFESMEPAAFSAVGFDVVETTNGVVVSIAESPWQIDEPRWHEANETWAKL